MNAQSDVRAQSRARVSESAIGAIPVTYPDGDQVFAEPTRALHVGTAGHLSVVFANGSSALLKNIGDGDLRPYAVVKIIQADTTATDIVALF